MSQYNDRPLENIDSQNPMLILKIIERSEGTMRLKADSGQTAGAARYLGAIVSEDREIIYWVNETEPLP